MKINIIKFGKEFFSKEEQKNNAGFFKLDSKTKKIKLSFYDDDGKFVWQM